MGFINCTACVPFCNLIRFFCILNARFRFWYALRNNCDRADGDRTEQPTDQETSTEKKMKN